MLRSLNFCHVHTYVHRWFKLSKQAEKQVFRLLLLYQVNLYQPRSQETFFSLTGNHKWKASGPPVMTMSDSYAGSFLLLKLDLITMKHLRAAFKT